MKISIIGAGNVGSTIALRLLEAELGEVILVDIAKGLALAKALDLQDSQYIQKKNFRIWACEDIACIKDSDIVVVSAGIARRPGMTREELLNTNGLILKELCLKINELAQQAIVIIVTNPLDLMTLLAFKLIGFPRSRIFGMGISLDASRLANLIAKEVGVPIQDVEAYVIGSHGEGMLPILRLCRVKNKKLEGLLDEDKKRQLVQMTINRGAQIVNLLGNGSAYFAPSAAVASLVEAVVKDEKRIIGVSAYLNGEYGLSDVCLGVMARIGRGGIEEIVDLGLNQSELQTLAQTAKRLKEQFLIFQGLL